MSDQVVSNAWRASLATMIFATAALALANVYAAIFAALASAWLSAGGHVGLALCLAGGTAWLFVNQSELTTE